MPSKRRYGASRPTTTGLSDVKAGCLDCSPDYMAIWHTRNALAIAARHHDATGHRTWVDQVIHVRYGEWPDKASG